jgi:hypothetical protein
VSPLMTQIVTGDVYNGSCENTLWKHKTGTLPLK